MVVAERTRVLPRCGGTLRRAGRPGSLTLRAEGPIAREVRNRAEVEREMAARGLLPLERGERVPWDGRRELAALVNCAGVTVKAVAMALGIELRAGRVVAEGDARSERAGGFTEIRLRFEVETDASPGQVERLARLTEWYCVVLKEIRAGASVRVEVTPA